MAGAQDPNTPATRQTSDVRDATHEDLRAFAVSSVQQCLEVAAGLRPPRRLDGRATGDVLRWLRGRARAAATPDHPASADAARNFDPGRIHRIAVQRTPDRVHVTALIRSTDRSVSALTMQLREVDRRWQITTIEHLRRGQHHTHRQPDIAGDHQPQPGRFPVGRSAFSDATLLSRDDAASTAVDLAILRGAAAADQHRAALAAQQATRLTARATYWLDRAARIASRTTALEQRDQPAPHLLAMLGPRPSNGPARGIWDQAAAMIETYRETWGITDPTLPLGAPPGNGDRRSSQQRHRQHTVKRVNELLHAMTGIRPPGRHRGRFDRGLDLSP